MGKQNDPDEHFEEIIGQMVADGQLAPTEAKKALEKLSAGQRRKGTRLSTSGTRHQRGTGA